MSSRRRFHRLVFCATGIYNIAWGLHAVYDPQWLFRFAGIPPLNHPQIFACLGMVVGLYGIVYLEVARVSGTRLAAGGDWFGGEDSWTRRFGFPDLERDVAKV